MSIEVMSLVWSRRVGSPSRKAVLQAMADAANSDGTGVWISKPTIAARSEVSAATVKRAMKELTEMGLIKRVGKKKISNGFTAIYDLDLEAIRALPHSQDDGGQNEPGITVTPDTGSPRPPTPGHSDPQTTLEPSLNRPLPTDARGRLKPDLPSETFLAAVQDAWNRMAEAHGFPRLERMTQDRIRLLRTRLAECGGDETLLLQVIGRVPLMRGWRGGGNRNHITFDWVHGPPSLGRPDRFLEALEYNPDLEKPDDRTNRPTRKSAQRSATETARAARAELLGEMAGMAPGGNGASPDVADAGQLPRLQHRAG